MTEIVVTDDGFVIKATLFDENKVLIDPASFIVGGSWEMTDGLPWDFGVIKYLYEKTKNIENATMVDVGANTGSYCLIPTVNKNIKKIICVEPNALIINILKKNILLNGLYNITDVYFGAVTDKEEKVTFTVRKVSSGQGNIGGVGDGSGSLHHQVTATTLDKLMNGEQVDILKIDAEGSDLAILKSGMNTIKKYKPDILIEYTNMRNGLLFDVFDLLLPLGYTYEFIGMDDLFLTTREKLNEYPLKEIKKL